MSYSSRQVNFLPQSLGDISVTQDWMHMISHVLLLTGVA